MNGISFMNQRIARSKCYGVIMPTADLRSVLENMKQGHD